MTNSRPFHLPITAPSAFASGYNISLSILFIFAVFLNNRAYAEPQRGDGTGALRSLFTTPPSIDRFVYRLTRATNTHLVQLTFQNDSFLVKRCNDISSLKSPKASHECSIAGRLGTLFWSRLSQMPDQLNITDAASGEDGSPFQSSSVLASNAVYAIAGEALNILFMATPICNYRNVTWSNNVFFGTDLFGASFSGSVVRESASGPSQVKVRIAHPEGARFERTITYSDYHSTSPWPSIMSVNTRNLTSGQETTFDVQVLEAVVSKGALPTERFLWSDGMFDGVRQINRYTNKTRLLTKVDSSSQRVVLFGRLYRQGEVVSVYVAIVCLFTVAMFFVVRHFRT